VPRLCERPGCSSAAQVAYGFDADHLVVWLDRLIDAEPSRTGVLCRRHADAMVVPLGWMLDDRREPVPQLFRPPTPVSPPASVGDDTRGTRRPRLPRPDVEQLRFDEPVDAHRADRHDADRHDADRHDAEDEPTLLEAWRDESVAHGPHSAGEAPTDLDGVVVAAASPGRSLDVETPSGTLDSDGAAMPLPAAAEDAPAEPWQPRFDQRDDLQGLLQARGRLLSRAFRGVDLPDSTP
jgi:hypothetical protein